MEIQIECLNREAPKLSKKDNIYILKTSSKDGCELLKLGYSSNLKKRMISYLSHNPFTEILFTFYREDGLEFEKWFHHNNLSDCKNEWYTIEKLEFIIQTVVETTNITNNLKRRPKYVEVSFKECSFCKEVKESAFFNKDMSRKTGLCDICRECYKIKNKYYRDKRNN